MKAILILLFIARVSIPMGTKTIYEAKSFTTSGEHYILVLLNDRRVLVPIMWTVIEER